ncbi:hypothetical protein [Chryseobacterium taihuense]|uniref:Uncharacterized protein n=1 Tax=Chryseobacterium taihuense TaxID=1141221 RepID=A0ABY0QVL7_9FLAO|nr:hypothetical protein [Chryseobacterium taihuense]SDL96209.1 hypothetical protein SAMN05216273_109128 [Chryseobacterium taihuense]
MKKKLTSIGLLLLLSYNQSCSNTNDEIMFDESAKTSQIINNVKRVSASDSKSLKGYVSNILAINNEIKALIDNDKTANFSYISANIGTVKSLDELQQLYKQANVTHSNDLIQLFQQANTETEIFINSNENFYTNFDEVKRSEMILNEIDNQLGFEDYGLSARTNCQANFSKQQGRCMRNYAISMTGVAVSGFFSFGVSTVVGGAVATTMMMACIHDSEEDYWDCVHAGGIR